MNLGNITIPVRLGAGVIAVAGTIAGTTTLTIQQATNGPASIEVVAEQVEGNLVIIRPATLVDAGGVLIAHGEFIAQREMEAAILVMWVVDAAGNSLPPLVHRIVQPEGFALLAGETYTWSQPVLDPNVARIVGEDLQIVTSVRQEAPPQPTVAAEPPDA